MHGNLLIDSFVQLTYLLKFWLSIDLKNALWKIHVFFHVQKLQVYTDNFCATYF